MIVCTFSSMFFGILICTTGVFCERIEASKAETKIEIEVTYLYEKYSERLHPQSDARPIYKVIQLTYNMPNLPKASGTESRSVYRHSNNNNNHLRNGFRFSTNDKGTGAFTMPTYENEAPESGLRVRNNLVLFGKLIHIVSVLPVDGNSSAVPTWSHNACHEPLNSVQGNWVALVRSGSCAVEKKLQNIMKLPNQPVSIVVYGSSQVIIRQGPFFSLNHDDSPMVIFLPWNNIQGVVQKCFNSSGHVHIPSEWTQKINNRSMLDWSFTDHNQCNITIKVYITSDDNFLNRTSVLFVSISFILLMVISLAWLMFYYVQRFRYIHTKEQFSRRLAHMAKKAVAKIPVKTLKQGDKETDAEVDNCAICIECYKPSDTVRILPCMHYFHKGCIDPWLLEQRNCPMCKLNILHAYGFLPNERGGSMISEEHLSELDSSVEMQFIPGPSVAPPYHHRPSSLIQAHCPTNHCSEICTVTAPSTTVIPLPPIFNESTSQEHHWWTLLRFKRPLASSHHLDRSLSLRYLSSSVEERATFLHTSKPLSHSTNNTAINNGRSVSEWSDTRPSSSSTAKVPECLSQNIFSD